MTIFELKFNFVIEIADQHYPNWISFDGDKFSSISCYEVDMIALCLVKVSAIEQGRIFGVRCRRVREGVTDLRTDGRTDGHTLL